MPLWCNSPRKQRSLLATSPKAKVAHTLEYERLLLLWRCGELNSSPNQVPQRESTVRRRFLDLKFMS